MILSEVVTCTVTTQPTTSCRWWCMSTSYVTCTWSRTSHCNTLQHAATWWISQALEGAMHDKTSSMSTSEVWVRQPTTSYSEVWVVKHLSARCVTRLQVWVSHMSRMSTRCESKPYDLLIHLCVSMSYVTHDYTMRVMWPTHTSVCVYVICHSWLHDASQSHMTYSYICVCLWVRHMSQVLHQVHRHVHCRSYVTRLQVK